MNDMSETYQNKKIGDDMKNMLDIVNDLLIKACYSDMNKSERDEVINTSEATLQSVIILINENQKNIINIEDFINDVNYLRGMLAILECG
jgi:hypothetical protein